MRELDIINLLHNKFVTRADLEKRLEAITIAKKAELDQLITSLLYKGIIGTHNNSYYLLEEEQVFLAKVTTKKKNFIILTVIPGSEEIRISGKESEGLLLGDLVYVKEFQKNVFHCIDYLKPVTELKGRYTFSKDGKEQIIVDYLNECGKQVLITEKEEGLVVHEGDLVLGEIKSMRLNAFTVKLTKVLVKASEVGSDISMIISSFDAPLNFDEEVIKEAEEISDKVSEEEKKGRIDFTSQCVVTIDGDDAKDYDDAVQARRLLNGYEVVVHIADVTHYVKRNHPLDNEASDRGTSIYVADRVVPMLPFKLSNGICSLNPDEERLTLSVIMNVDAKGNVFNTRVVRGLIKSKGRLTYNKVNAYFNGENVDYSAEIKQTLDILRECAKHLSKRRELNGALMELSSVELKFTLDEEGNPVSVKKNEQLEAEKMIEDLMIAANCAVAKMLKEKKVPVLYRVHDKPSSEKLTDFKQFLKRIDPQLVYSFPKSNLSSEKLNEFLKSIKDNNLKESISYMLLRALAKAEYSTEEIGHFGLAEPYYCHFTSPIRRYPDDIVHRLVKDYIIDEKPFDYDDLTSYLDIMADKTSSLEVRADKIEREVDDLESAKYMASRIGEQFHGKVTGIILRGMFIQTDIGIEGFLPFACMHGDSFTFKENSYIVTGKYHPEISFTIGTEIDVVVLSCNLYAHEIDFATPEFYQMHAVSISDEARADLARNGIRITNDEEEQRMTRKMPFPKKGERVYKDSQVSNEEKKTTRSSHSINSSGYQGKKKDEKPSDFKRSRKDGKPNSKDKKPSRPTYNDHKGYQNQKPKSTKPTTERKERTDKPRFKDDKPRNNKKQSNRNYKGSSFKGKRPANRKPNYKGKSKSGYNKSNKRGR